ncbi:MAG: type I-E CRISPR-associated endoribonuclease Cas2e [Clostridiales bacterium]|nr:type I-E CRISPR-associated endoribonuclease Cas2e [Clostridiales bacterium]
MTVVILTDCPSRLRGDLTKWLLEINTGVYVGRVSARVRDQLWERICANVKTGRATMVFRASNEQRMDFRVHNTTWQPVDFDGVKLMRRPLPSTSAKAAVPYLPDGFSRAAQQQKARRMAAARQRKIESRYVVVDVETTGLNAETDEIIEMAALRIENARRVAEFQRYVSARAPLPTGITALTGISDSVLLEQGIPLAQAMQELLAFLDGSPLLCHNAPFDQSFLLAACQKCGLPPMTNRIHDTLILARRKVKGVADYKLATLARHFGIAQEQQHRALADCYAAYELYAKLNEI